MWGKSSRFNQEQARYNYKLPGPGTYDNPDPLHNKGKSPWDKRDRFDNKINRSPGPGCYAPDVTKPVPNRGVFVLSNTNKVNLRSQDREGSPSIKIGTFE